MDNGNPLIPEKPPTNALPTSSRMCLHPGCIDKAVQGSDYCAGHRTAQEKRELETIVGVASINPDGSFTIPEGKKGPTNPAEQSSGGDNDYWVANVTDPKRLAPYKAEAEDLIELFQFSFAEGNAFKALWRMGMDRVATGKPGDTPLRNAEKVAYYGSRMVAAFKTRK